MMLNVGMFVVTILKGLSTIVPQVCPYVCAEFFPVLFNVINLYLKLLVGSVDVISVQFKPVTVVSADISCCAHQSCH